MLKQVTLDRIFWSFIAFLCLTHGYLLIPNCDDGAYFYQIYNTIRLYNPFYNDYYGQYFHFMKPTTLLYALLYSINNNPNFRLIALIQSAEIFASTWLVYLCARRYASEVASKAGALIFLYFLFVHNFLSPTRPETTVLLCSIAVFWLCECFSDTKKVTYLVIASAIIFLVAIPMHTNGSISLIYFIAYLFTRRHQASPTLFVKLGVFSTVFAALGFAIIVYPGFSSLAGSLAWLAYDGGRFERFSLLKSEYVRMRWFLTHYYSFPLILFIVAVCCVRLFNGYRQLKTPASLKKYLTLILFLLAVLLGLGILPSAAWGVYIVYYYLPLVLLFSVAFDFFVRRECNHFLKRFVFILVGVSVFWYSYGTMPKLYMLLYAGPFLVAAVLARRITVLQTMLIIVLPMLAFRTVEMMSSKIIYDRAVRKIAGAQGLVLASRIFNFCGENVFPAEGFRTQISGTQGTTIIELKSIASVHADRINAHPLVTFFGPARNSHKESKWASRRILGNEFQHINNDAWKMPDYITGQVKPLHYSIVKEVPLSNKMLDRYADPAVKGLKCIEYRRLM